MSGKGENEENSFEEREGGERGKEKEREREMKLKKVVGIDGIHMEMNKYVLGGGMHEDYTYKEMVNRISWMEEESQGLKSDEYGG